MDANLKLNLLWIIAAVGVITLVGAFLRMRSGFGMANLRVIVILLTAVLAALVMVFDDNYRTAFIAIISAALGYVVGVTSGDRSDALTREDVNSALGEVNTKLSTVLTSNGLAEALKPVTSKVENLNSDIADVKTKLSKAVTSDNLADVLRPVISKVEKILTLDDLRGEMACLALRATSTVSGSPTENVAQQTPSPPVGGATSHLAAAPREDEGTRSGTVIPAGVVDDKPVQTPERSKGTEARAEVPERLAEPVQDKPTE